MNGLTLIDAAITGVAHCAPPGNKPLPEELANCSTFLARDVRPDGQISSSCSRSGASRSTRACDSNRERGWLPPGAPKPRFGHGEVSRPSPEAPISWHPFHPSQQNTFTGRLTAEMMRKRVRRVPRAAARRTRQRGVKQARKT